ncbi:MAG: Hsp20/alpha crystallin family protein [Planctomycetota bacterium]
MIVSRYSPSVLFSQMNRLSDEMDRVFAGSGETSATWHPRVDAWSTEEAIHVDFELPGVSMENVEITVTGENQLSVRGERAASEETDVTWHRRERLGGEFHRVLELPELVDTKSVQARFRDGVLSITLPKREEARPHRIEVQVD